MAWVSPEGETPGESKKPEVLEQTMRRVLKSELEAQTDRLRQQINEDVSLHFAEQSVEAISKKAQELVEASITLESSLRDHKEFLQSLVNPDSFNGRKSPKDEAPAAKTGSNGHLHASSGRPGEAWFESIQEAKGSQEEEEEAMSSVVPVPHVPVPKEEANQKPAHGGHIPRGMSGRKNVLAEDFMHEVDSEEEEEQMTTAEGQNLRGKVRYLLSRQWFDMLIGFFIILNSVVLGLQADWNVRHIGQQEPEVFGVSEKLFAVVFTGELLLRIFGLGFYRFYWGPDWRWAFFDTFIVSLQIFDEISTLFVTDAATQQGNFGFMRVIRVLRLLRIMRLVRILQFVNELRTMVMSVANSMRSLGWTIVLMLLIKYIIGVYLCQLIADTGFDNPSALSTDLMNAFGSLPRAVLSLYQAMTGGIDWNDLSYPLETSISPLLAVVFALYIAFAVLAMMNVVTGVFVESALGSAREDREREVIHAVRKIFNMGDANRNGVLSWNEFSGTLEDPSNARYFTTIGINAQEARGLFNLLDADDSGSISVQEFIQGCLRLRGQAKAIDLATLIYMTKRMVFWLQDRLEYVEGSLEKILPPEKKTPRPSAMEQKGEVKRFLNLGDVNHIAQVKETRASTMSIFAPSQSKKSGSHQAGQGVSPQKELAN